MKTFTPPRPFQPHPDFRQHRERSLQSLEQEITKGTIDTPLLPLVREFMKVPHCFTLQCCYGHFVHAMQPDNENLSILSGYTKGAGRIEYRIAYLAICLEDTPCGHSLYVELADIPRLDPVYIQFGTADWFWEQMPNTFCLQLEPERIKKLDSGIVSWDEAVRIEEIREPFFKGLIQIIHRHQHLSCE